jgi:hypothetical protein
MTLGPPIALNPGGLTAQPVSGTAKKGLAPTTICGTILSRLMLLYRLWNVEESGRKVTLAAFFCVRPKTAKLC